VLRYEHSSRDNNWRREVTREARGPFDWNPWGWYEPDDQFSTTGKRQTIAKPLAENLCRYALLPKKEAKRFIQKKHQQILSDIECSYLRRSERFKAKSEDQSHSQPSAIGRICKER